jgi:hypothetical protein
MEVSDAADTFGTDRYDKDWFTCNPLLSLATYGPDGLEIEVLGLVIFYDCPENEIRFLSASFRKV